MNEKYLEKIVHENNRTVCSLSSQIIQLEVVQGAVERLMERIDEITHGDLNEGEIIKRIAINEIKDTVRLIDMAFRPLFKEMSEGFDELNDYSQELHNTVIKSKLKSKF